MHYISLGLGKARKNKSKKNWSEIAETASVRTHTSPDVTEFVWSPSIALFYSVVVCTELT